MKRVLLIATLLAFVSCVKSLPQLNENNIERVIKLMTAEEKARLLVFGNNQYEEDSTQVDMIAACKNIVPGSAGFTYPIWRLGIPSIVMADGPAGLRIAATRKGSDRTFYCTGFPVGSLLSSTWDVNLVEEMSAAIGEEVLEYGVDVLLAPGQNLHRNPLCGRNFEYFSEDPLLSGKISAAYVRGVQSVGVGTSVKHFAVNNSEVNRLSCDSRVSLRAARELYLKNFEITIRESSPWTVMTSYNYLNGRYTSEDAGLLKGILRGDWGYGGVIVSDWGGGYDARAQIAASNDLLAPGHNWQVKAILAAMQSGKLSEKDIDACVRRVLELIVKTPRFKGYEFSNNPNLLSHAKIARKAAADGMVLLENRSALPLQEGVKVAMFGTNSYKLIAGGTGAGCVNKAYTISLDKGLAESGFTLDVGTDEAYREFLDKERMRMEEINAKRGWWYGDLPFDELPEAKLRKTAISAASSADVAVITLVRQAGEGRDRLVKNDFNLKPSEISLINEVTEAFHSKAKKVIVVLNVTGVVETASWKNKVDGILLAWQPGQEAGYAIADILGGVVNPSGHLPVSFPVKYSDVPSQNFPQVQIPELKNGSWWHHKAGWRYYEEKNIDWIDYTEDIYMGYRYYLNFGSGVSYPFGYGLSYTDFSIDNMEIIKVDGIWDVSVDVSNTGSRDGREVVQLYTTPYALNDGHSLELRAFAKTGLLKPGETERVILRVTEEDLAVFNEKKSAWVTRSGDYMFCIATDVNSVVQYTIETVQKELVRPVTRAIEPVRLTATDGNNTCVKIDSAVFKPSDLFIGKTTTILNYEINTGNR